MKKNSEESEPGSLYQVNADIIVKDSRWLDLNGFEDVEFDHYVNNVFLLVLKYTNFLKYAHHVEAAVLLTDDEELQRLNHEFRHKDKPTNVLSFPMHMFYDGDFSGVLPHDGEHCFLGDIAISYQRIHDESIEQVKTFKEHFTHILVHAFLHLLGYDHIEDEAAEQMEKIEIAIMHSMGFKDPYNIDHVASTLQIKY